MNEPNMTRSQQMYEGLLNESSNGFDDRENGYDERLEPCPSCGKPCDEHFDVWPEDQGLQGESLAVCMRCWESHGEPTQEEIDQIKRGHDLVRHLDGLHTYGFVDLLIEQAIEDLVAAFGLDIVKTAVAKQGD